MWVGVSQSFIQFDVCVCSVSSLVFCVKSVAVCPTNNPKIEQSITMLKTLAVAVDVCAGAAQSEGVAECRGRRKCSLYHSFSGVIERERGKEG